MTALLAARVSGIPGPKGSVNAFCVRCASKHLKPAVVVKEQSEGGVAFRKLVARELKTAIGARGPEVFTGPVETRLTFYIERRRVVKAGVAQDAWIPSHQSPVPAHRNSGDVEKHVRTVHDALMDAGVLADDSQVWKTTAAKRWATDENPPGVVIEVQPLTALMIASLALEVLP